MLLLRAYLPLLLRLSALSAAVLIPSALVGLIAARIWAGQGFAFEVPLMLWIHHHVGSWFAPVAVIMHYVGKTSLAVPLITLAAVWLHFRKRTGYAAFLILSTALPTLVMLLSKAVFDRPRPMLWPRLIEESNTSFPSGHSTFAAALATLLFIIFLHSPKRTLLLTGGIVFTLLMGFSRVYLGVHYPTDVLAGWINGCATVCAVYFCFFRKYLHK
ncbi:phosphatase PAP2 family protein [Neisseria animalis]|uniref:PAP2 family protein n=1 Tax=Neisseria animalis TaxID=492 RepID=A0A5P3MR53_NEIAN|nr:phosphatase PAP2 family protein [Neisseria animalis]QEY24073.1 PAP2 family protein [Neisseria animalis]ROW32640.1 phosphatase PAP2 family protein [Neisseria animalis]VEE06216.1 phosphatidylglycerophosphatase B [Neisseria animalis]